MSQLSPFLEIAIRIGRHILARGAGSNQIWFPTHHSAFRFSGIRNHKFPKTGLGHTAAHQVERFAIGFRKPLGERCLLLFPTSVIALSSSPRLPSAGMSFAQMQFLIECNPIVS